MEFTSNDILKLIERASGIPDILSRKDDLEQIVGKMSTIEEYVKRFGTLEDLTVHFKQMEDKMYLWKTYLNTEEACRYLSLSKFTLLEAVKRHEIVYYTPPSKSFYYTKEDLDKWFEKYRKPATEILPADDAMMARAELKSNRKYIKK